MYAFNLGMQKTERSQNISLNLGMQKTERSQNIHLNLGTANCAFLIRRSIFVIQYLGYMRIKAR